MRYHVAINVVVNVVINKVFRRRKSEIDFVKA